MCALLAIMENPSERFQVFDADALHVLRATCVDESIDKFCPERVVRPFVEGHGDNIDVRIQHEARQGGVFA